jgi:hypothetical protein
MKILLLCFLTTFVSVNASAGDPFRLFMDPNRPRQSTLKQDPSLSPVAVSRAKSLKAQALVLIRAAARKYPRLGDIIRELKQVDIVALPDITNKCNTGGIAQIKGFVYENDQMQICPIFASLTDEFAMHVFLHEASHLVLSGYAGECGADSWAHVIEVVSGHGFIESYHDKSCGLSKSNYMPPTHEVAYRELISRGGQ